MTTPAASGKSAEIRKCFYNVGAVFKNVLKSQQQQSTIL
jgi:hypothetical protein